MKMLKKLNFSRLRTVFPSVTRWMTASQREFHIIDHEEAAKFESTVGYNGFMIHSPQYALLFSEKKDHYLENAAFIMQALTLKLTTLGLAACWLTINDADKAKAQIGISTDKTLAVVVGFRLQKIKTRRAPAWISKARPMSRSTRQRHVQHPRFPLTSLFLTAHSETRQKSTWSLRSIRS
jgi:hypothetical protein